MLLTIAYMANFKETMRIVEGKQRILIPGECLCSVDSIFAKVKKHISYFQVRRCIDFLKKAQIVTDEVTKDKRRILRLNTTFFLDGDYKATNEPQNDRPMTAKEPQNDRPVADDTLIHKDINTLKHQDGVIDETNTRGAGFALTPPEPLKPKKPPKPKPDKPADPRIQEIIAHHYQECKKYKIPFPKPDKAYSMIADALKSYSIEYLKTMITRRMGTRKGLKSQVTLHLILSSMSINEYLVWDSETVREKERCGDEYGFNAR